VKWAHVERARDILAREQGTVVKDWGGKLPIALVYPNTYHVGMSSLGFQTIYAALNGHRDVVCERAFWQRRFSSDDPVVSVESQQALADFYVVAFSISFEMDYLHVVQILRQAGIPLRADERDEDWPVVIAGGPAVSANPLPLADLVDGVLVGEAEEGIAGLVETLWEGIDKPRPELWQRLARLPGLYVPALDPKDKETVTRQWVRDMETFSTATVIHTPDTEFGGMHLIEIARGCGRGCRFCLAGFACRPKRERSLESILAQAERGLEYRDRIGLVSAAVSDYTQIDALASQLREMGARLSVSSLRVDPLSEPLLRALSESDARTLTMAPEAGSQRLRDMINKNVTEADLVHAAERASDYAFGQLKLYFMIGLPTETEDDISEIASLCRTVAHHFRGRVTANVTPFVPKAHTPFQWAAMAPVEVLDARYAQLQQELRRKGIAVRGESAQWSAIQGILARGDRRLNDVLTSVQGHSTRAWYKAMQRLEVDPQDYLGEREMDQTLPWSFVDSGVRDTYLRRERERAIRGAATEPCPVEGCDRCGVCKDP